MTSFLIVVILCMVFVGSTLSMSILLALLEWYKLLNIFHLVNGLFLFGTLGLTF